MAILTAFIALSIFKTIEFYVIISVVAAAVIAFATLPESKGEVKIHMLQGDLVTEPDLDTVEVGPGHGRLICECHAGNIVTIRREGLHGVSTNGAVSLVVKVSGFDITIEERVSTGSHPSSGVATSAIFHLDFLAPEWYHIRYESEQYGEHAAFTLHVRDGIVLTKQLIH